MRRTAAGYAILGVALAGAVHASLLEQAAGGETRASHQTGDGPTIEIVLRPTASQQSRASDYLAITTTALDAFAAWLGPLPFDELTVAGVPSSSALSPGQPARVLVPGRWSTLRGDRAAERFIIAGLARQYWVEAVRFRPDARWLASGLSRFTATRAVHDLVDGDHYATPVFFGGHLPYPVRRAPQSQPETDPRPYRRSFDEVGRVMGDATGVRERAIRAARALQTLERHLGWPVLQNALAVFARRFQDREAAVADFVAVCEEVSGRDLAWFFDDAFRTDAHYDYGVGRLTTTSRGSDGGYETTVTVRRYGDAVFSGTSQPPLGDFEAGRAVEIAVWFADGTEVRDHWDGRAPSRDFRFTSRAPAVSAEVDPDAVLLLDTDWNNNRRVLSGSIGESTAQWALLWTAWLQGVLLTVIAIV